MATIADRGLLYLALLGHGGATLRPDWDAASQDDLTDAIDRLRQRLFRARQAELQGIPQEEK